MKKEQNIRRNINSISIPAKRLAKLLEVEIDNKLKFDKHVQNLCQKANKMTSAFNYFPSIWLFCNKVASKK